MNNIIRKHAPDNMSLANIELLEDELRTIMGFRSPPAEIIKDVILRYFNITKEQFESSNRMPDAIFPRYFFYLFARKHTILSLLTIARMSGKENHSNCIHGIKVLNNAIETDLNSTVYDYNELAQKFRIIFK